MSRIDRKFAALRQRGEKAFVAFVTAGDPSKEDTILLVRELEQRGVDIIELGVPFSDPVADGMVIQKSSQRALASGTSLSDVLDMVSELREESEIPIAIMTYYNPVFKYGISHFVSEAAAKGLDGVIIPDLPPEEAGELQREACPADMNVVFFASPTSTPGRIKLISESSTGFIYYISIIGITGASEKLNQEIKLIENGISTIRSFTDKPVAVGFGVATPAQAAQVAGWADGVIVGSAIITQIEQHTGKPDFYRQVGDFVKELVAAVK